MERRALTPAVLVAVVLAAVVAVTGLAVAIVGIPGTSTALTSSPVSAATTPASTPATSAARPAATETVTATRTAAAGTAAPAPRVRTLDLRYTEDGHFFRHDYADDGAIEVYKKGTLGATRDGPILATVTFTPTRQGSAGTVTVTVTSKRRVLISPANFTWLGTHHHAAGPRQVADLVFAPGTHPKKITFTRIHLGKVQWNTEPTMIFTRPTN